MKKPATRFKSGVLLVAVLLAAMPLGVALADNGTRQTIHPDCASNPEPVLCTIMVRQLITELGYLEDAFVNPNAMEIADFYHPQATVYTAARGQFVVGRENILSQIYAPFVAGITTAHLDFSVYHFSVISPDVIVAYGAVPGGATLKNGSTLTQNPLPQTTTWVRNPRFDPKRPFLLASEQE